MPQQSKITFLFVIYNSFYSIFKKHSKEHCYYPMQSNPIRRALYGHMME